jgi:dGTP triphosphohydrolase
MKYANIENGTNKLLGWYDKEIHLEIPTPNIEVTDEVWQEALNINANCYENGEFILKDFTTNEQREQQRIQQIETKCNQVIEAVYPIYKQINITNLLTPYTEEDREDMKAFIDSKRAICHQAITEGTSVVDINWEVPNG